MDWKTEIWNQYPAFVLGFLGLLNALLMIYTAKNLPKLFKKITPAAKLDDPDDRVALRTFRSIVNSSQSVNMEMLQKIIYRNEARKIALASCLKKVAATNPKLIFELLDKDMSDWMHIVCLKVLVKVGAEGVLPKLMKAQEDPSEAVQKTANELLAKILAIESLKVAS